jgi:adenylylsulfate kinase-like enzyme
VKAVSEKNQVLYLTGVAGSGKTLVLFSIIQQLKGRVQACASTGIAAHNLNVLNA